MRRGLVLAPVFTVVAAAVAAGACSEHFPDVPAPPLDASSAGDALEPTPPPIVPPAQRVNASSTSVAFDPLRGGVWTANGDVGTASYVDPVGRSVVQELALGKDIRSVAVSPDGAFVAAVDRLAGTVTLLDAGTRATRAVLATGGEPRACVWDSADPRWLYVALESSGTVAIVDRTLGVVADTVAVGRLPVGLAVSATRREVYVSHRVDADVTVVTLDDRQVAADVPLAVEPFTAATIPNGTPIGFESIALVADGSHLWAPHELLAPTHPFVFNETLFPAISVVDVYGRTEQLTDPNAGATAGRKNLFDAIDIPGNDGQPAVFSQPCAVAMHPNDLIGWALFCASEDLLTFDLNAGVATDALRALPCDHPSGLTLDATGDRLFVVCDGSKQLLTLDTSHGSLVSHTSLFGAPIQVAVDTVAASDPLLRTGRTLFARANSTKGALATTGNDWMSCGGCHLDGFGTTNAAVFAAISPPADEALDAQLGHVGLADHFTTATLSPGAGFDPHDVLVALLDQGGLAPDRTGASRAGQIDPSSPTPDAVVVAQALALVVAGDLPGQPSWLHPEGPPPAVAYDGAWCGQSACHPSEYAAWSASVHAHSALDAMVKFAATQEPPGFVPLCAGCHDPVSFRGGDKMLTSGRGVTCLGCHDVTSLIQGGGNADLVATSHDWTTDHAGWAKASLATLSQPAFCGGCHRQFVPGNAIVPLATLDEYAASRFAPGTRCVDCHMPVEAATGLREHRFPGGNVYLGETYGDATLVAEQTANLEGAIHLAASQVAGGVLVTMRNGGAGHWFPTGVTDLREPWLELQPLDASGAPLGGPVGGPDPVTQLLPPGAARLGIDLATPDGTVLSLHQLGLATRITYDQRVPSAESLAVLVPLATAPPGTASVEARLVYRNLRTPFFQAATGSSGAAPATLMASVTTPWSGP